MSNSLSSMSAAGSCLQQREHSSYPYMFHDPLHSLSSTYNHTAARAAAVSNPAVAHSQSAINTHPSYGGVTTSSAPATGTGKSSHACNTSQGSCCKLHDICGLRSRVSVTFMKKLRAETFWECLLPFSTEQFIFPPAIWKHHTFGFCFAQEWILLSPPEKEGYGLEVSENGVLRKYLQLTGSNNIEKILYVWSNLIIWTSL
jgi:hypothetical protein